MNAALNGKGRLFLAALLAGLLAACATTTPSDTGSDTPMDGNSYDGLVPVKAKGLKNAWVKPDINLGAYDQVLLAPVEFEFRATRPATTTGRITGSEFPVSPANRDRLAKDVTEVFRRELGASREFTLTDQPGPRVLLLNTSLLDIVSRVPPEQPGRNDIYLDRVGEATLVVELKDSMSGETLARAVDRRAAETFGGGLNGGVSMANRIDSVTAWNEVRQLAARWGRTLTARLDQLRTRGSMPGTDPAEPLR